MESLALLLMLMQAPASGSIPARIVERPDVAVTLVGQPCGDGVKAIATTPIDAQNPQSLLESPIFACGMDCTVGVRIKDGRRVASFTIATATAHDQGRTTSAVTHSLKPGSLPTCNGEGYFVVSMPRVDWPIVTGVVFVGGVTFEDGTAWKIDGYDISKEALKQWMLQPKPKQ